MLVLRLLVMVLTIICLMDGHAEVSSSTTGIRDRRESPAVKTNEQEVETLDRKKKKKPKPGKKKKPKPGKKKKPNKAKPTPTKPVTTTPTVSTSTLKTTTILTTPTVATTVTTTTTTVSPTSTVTTAKTTTSTASATTTLSTTTSATTSATTTTVATSSTASTTTTTIPTTAATTADSGAGGECKATNGKPCIFPFKDAKEYNECKNEGGKYFWCATSVYDSGKYKHWSYCSTDGPCPLEGDGECRAANNKPCVFPFKDGGKEYNECADHGGQYFWCATGTNSAGKYTAWSECPNDGSCPLPQKSTAPVMTPTASAATTTLLATGTSMAQDEIENKVVSSLKDLVKEESKDGTLEMLEAMNKITETIIEDLKAQSEDNDPKNLASNQTLEGGNPQSQELSLQYKQGAKSGETREIRQNFEYVFNTVSYRDTISPVSDASDCCSKCQSRWSNAALFDYFHRFGQCHCYEKKSNEEPRIRENKLYSAGECEPPSPCSVFKKQHTRAIAGGETLLHFPPVANINSAHGTNFYSNYYQVFQLLKDYAYKCCWFRLDNGDDDDEPEWLYPTCKDVNQVAFIAYIDNSLTCVKDILKEVKKYEPTDNQQGVNRCQRYFALYGDKEDDEDSFKEHTEVTLLEKHQPAKTNIFLYTYNSPCQNCLEFIYDKAFRARTTNIFVGFYRWYSKIKSCPVDCEFSRRHFCNKLEEFKWKYNPISKTKLHFVKIGLQYLPSSTCEDDTFTTSANNYEWVVLSGINYLKWRPNLHEC